METRYTLCDAQYFRRIVIVIFVALFIIVSLTAENQFPLSCNLDTALILFSATLDLSASYYNDNYVNPLTLSHIENAKKEDIIFFDRFAVDLNSKSLKDVSDITVYTVILMPIFSSLFTQRKYFVNDIIIYGEALLLQSGLARWSKYLTKRSRPFVYNPDISMDKQQEKNSRCSFFSMHSSTAFCSAVFGSYLYQQRGGTHSTYFWIISLGLASSTSAFRVLSGNHFPSDVIVGALVGSLIGYAVPYLHKKNNCNGLSFLVSMHSLSCQYKW